MPDTLIRASPILDDDDSSSPEWLKMVYHAIQERKTLLLKQGDEVVFPINPSSYKDMHTFLTEGVKPACQLAMDGCFTLSIAEDVPDLDVESLL
jgi:hypothetical protein